MFADRLREERKRLNLTQPEMAAACGVKVMSQSQYETGQRTPKTEYLLAALVIGVDVNYLLTGTRKGEPLTTPSPTDSPRLSVAEAQILEAYNALPKASRNALMTLLNSLRSRAGDGGGE